VYQIGVAPVRIDISTHIDGVDFDTAWGSRVEGTFFGVPVHFISLNDLIANKQAVGRGPDLDDLRHLRNDRVNLPKLAPGPCLRSWRLSLLRVGDPPEACERYSEEVHDRRLYVGPIRRAR